MASLHAPEYPSAAYVFDMLPGHPPPCPGESLSGYLLRLMELNGIVRLGDLRVLLFPFDLRSKGFEKGRLGFVDYPLPISEIIQCATARSADELLATTVFPVGQKFACETDPDLRYFLAESLCVYRRFCPRCLSEGRWYRLSWRFLHLTGCPLHGCSLLDSCSHCGSRIPLFQSHPRIGRCPTCTEDLATCDAPALDINDLSSVRRADDDLSFLLDPSRNRQQNAATLDQVGRLLRQARHQRNERRGKAAELSGIPYHRIASLEHRVNADDRITLQSFLAYLHYLGLSVRGVFEDAWQRPDMTEQIWTACQELRELGQEVTPAAVVWRLEIGVSVKALARRPEATAVLREVAGVQAHKRRGQQREGTTRQRADSLRREEVGRLVAQALEQLSQAPGTITLPAVARAAGVGAWRLEKHTEFREHIRIAQIAHTAWDGTFLSPSEREERLLVRLQEVVKLHKLTGAPLTQKALARAVPCGRSSFHKSLRIRAYLATILPRSRE